MKMLKIKQKTLFLLMLTTILLGQNCSAQSSLCENEDKELMKLYSKIFPFYYEDQDSLIYFSDLFSSKLISLIKNNPSTLECNFKLFEDSIGSIVTTSNGQFRIYSWDTWTGGTMRNYKNLFQFKSGGKVYVKSFDYGEDDMGTYFNKVYSFRIDSLMYILALAGGTESSRYSYEFVTVYSISDSILHDNIPLIETSTGVKSSISIEYDNSSLENLQAGESHLITFDEDKKILYIPMIENDMATKKIDRYQFTGQYFKKIVTGEEKTKRQKKSKHKD
jgi:hypothetical protein